MSVLGDRIIEGGPFSLAIQCGLSRTATAEEWNELRAELIGGRAARFLVSETARASRCAVCQRPVEQGMVECTGCAGSEDAAAKRSADQ